MLTCLGIGAQENSDQVNLGLIASNASLRPGCPTAECAFVYPVTASAGKSTGATGTVHSVSNNAMIFDREQALCGPEKQGTPNGVNAIELHGKKAAKDLEQGDRVVLRRREDPEGDLRGVLQRYDSRTGRVDREPHVQRLGLAG